MLENKKGGQRVMDMCYDGTLVMPSSYAMMEEDELSYVEGGGWSTYKGMEALLAITMICGCAFAFGKLTQTAGAALVASASTGVGLVAAIGCAIGVAIFATAAAYQGTLAVCAATAMISSYKKTHSFKKSGFKAESYGVWTFSVYTQIANL